MKNNNNISDDKMENISAMMEMTEILKNKPEEALQFVECNADRFTKEGLADLLKEVLHSLSYHVNTSFYRDLYPRILQDVQIELDEKYSEDYDMYQKCLNEYLHNIGKPKKPKEKPEMAVGEIRDRLLFLVKSICHMLDTAIWTVYNYDGSIEGLCGYEINYFKGDEVADSFYIQLQKKLSHGRHEVLCSDSAGEKMSFIISPDYKAAELVPVHEWIRERVNVQAS